MPLPERERRVFSLTTDAGCLIDALMKAMGVGKSAVIETALRELARIKRIKVVTDGGRG